MADRPDVESGVEARAGTLAANATIGILTALPRECAAVRRMLQGEVRWKAEGEGGGRDYYIGEVPSDGGAAHVVAVALLQDMGNNSAALRAQALLHHFPKVRHLVMCGIAGGVPQPGEPEHDVRLGDIVVSNRGGVVQYDLVKEHPDGKEDHRHPPRPPSPELLDAARHLQTEEAMGNRPWEAFLAVCGRILGGERPQDNIDARGVEVVYPPDRSRSSGMPRVFHSPIAAANTLLKNRTRRDYLGKTFGVKAVEMEGSGVADATWFDAAGYLVVRGICDYCDENKGDLWHGPAAAAAAAYVRALIGAMQRGSTSRGSPPKPSVGPPGAPQGAEAGASPLTVAIPQLGLGALEITCDTTLDRFDLTAFLTALATATGVSVSQLHVAWVRRGSVKVRIELPADAILRFVEAMGQDSQAARFRETTRAIRVSWTAAGRRGEVELPGPKREDLGRTVMSSDPIRVALTALAAAIRRTGQPAPVMEFRAFYDALTQLRPPRSLDVDNVDDLHQDIALRMLALVHAQPELADRIDATFVHRAMQWAQVDARRTNERRSQRQVSVELLAAMPAGLDDPESLVARKQLVERTASLLTRVVDQAARASNSGKEHEAFRRTAQELLEVAIGGPASMDAVLETELRNGGGAGASTPEAMARARSVVYRRHQRARDRLREAYAHMRAPNPLDQVEGQDADEVIRIVLRLGPKN